MWRIYGLVDPRDEQVRYVGCTTLKWLSSRLSCHLDQAKFSNRKGYGTLRSEWIRQVLGAGLRPRILLLQTAFSEDEAARVEDEWIQRFAGQLTNQIGGGPGAPSPSPEVLARRIATFKENWRQKPLADRAKQGERGRASIKKAQAQAQTPAAIAKRSVSLRAVQARKRAEFLALPEEERERILQDKRERARVKRNEAQQRRRKAAKRQ